MKSAVVSSDLPSVTRLLRLVAVAHGAQPPKLGFDCFFILWVVGFKHGHQEVSDNSETTLEPYTLVPIIAIRFCNTINMILFVFCRSQKYVVWIDEVIFVGSSFSLLFLYIFFMGGPKVPTFQRGASQICRDKAVDFQLIMLFLGCFWFS